jgi:hypothetical protein
MADALPHSHHFPLLMLPGDLPMVMQSEAFTQLLELGNLTTLQQTHGKYGDTVVGSGDLLPLSPKQLRLQVGASSPWLKFPLNCAFPVSILVLLLGYQIYFFTIFLFVMYFHFAMYICSLC